MVNDSTTPTRRRPTPEWLSITQYAAAYEVHPQTVRKWIDNGNNGGQKVLIAWQIGKVVRIKNVPPTS